MGMNRLRGFSDPWTPTPSDYADGEGFGFLPLLAPLAAPLIGSLASGIGSIFGGGGKSKQKKEEYKSRARAAESQVATLQTQLTTAEQAALAAKQRSSLFLYGGLGVAGLFLVMMFLRRKRR